jgi:hypothetical protein
MVGPVILRALPVDNLRRSPSIFRPCPPLRNRSDLCLASVSSFQGQCIAINSLISALRCLTDLRFAIPALRNELNLSAKVSLRVGQFRTPIAEFSRLSSIIGTKYWMICASGRKGITHTECAIISERSPNVHRSLQRPNSVP